MLLITEGESRSIHFFTCRSRPRRAAEGLLTEFDVLWFIRVHLVGVAAGDVSPDCHRGVCEDEML